MLNRYAKLVEETANAMASMLAWDAGRKRYSLKPPIWIAQEIYAPRESRNPAFELAYWRYGLTVAQAWRERLGEEPHSDWQAKIDRLAMFGLLNDETIDRDTMDRTFDAVPESWDFEGKSWGWDYPMIAMMATGWAGAPDRPAPGFPDDGTWTVRAEGLLPLD